MKEHVQPDRDPSSMQPSLGADADVWGGGGSLRDPKPGKGHET